MKIGIIITGWVEPELARDFGEYADMIESTLAPAGQFEFECYQAINQQLPPTLHTCQGYIITGSVQDAFGDQAWIHALMAWIVDCEQAKVPLVGLCFGHQIICRALGGHVERSQHGWGLGVSQNRYLASAQATASNALPAQGVNDNNTLNILSCHQDQVTEIPQGFEVLAASDFCPYYFLRKDQHVLTIQGHPEFSLDFMAQVLELKKPHLNKAVYRNAKHSLTQRVDSAEFMTIIRQFLQR
ncbi:MULTISPECIES: gamma-glutamyl-gamma-aminobutyrate hydrolase family protein [unclassified Vibrio]|uniref:Gamma-glutamyl-gamma-aminobutyrate hydrolase family protein n=1 Tax=Vibrio sp. HB236076 TaxID=3232307 RepID=A0AB39HEB3_9VIBR|nr:gamma-glutamyl-gamma-aminobutyrate hydrolase family protein [Vibrio sp. HB161653]MDP5255180.1 gamma-glutamyl-gamma-aminobutyrate hydrolase family protein [Vibrio sp. HB161653]